MVPRLNPAGISFKGLALYAVPLIGDMPLNQIESGDLLRVLAPIWNTKAETARRVRQRLRTVFDWAKASGFIDGENPINGVAAGLPKQNERVKHHTALPYAEIPDFLRWLDKSGSGINTKAALKLLILTATRTSEVLNTDWSEFDLQKGIWTIPAVRMKAVSWRNRHKHLEQLSPTFGACRTCPPNPISMPWPPCASVEPSYRVRSSS